MPADCDRARVQVFVTKTATKVRVMIVDDEPLQLKALSTMLEKSNYEVVTYSDPRKAIARLAPTEPPIDVILLDIAMPEMDGPDILCAMEQIAHSRAIPIIFETGHAELGKRLAERHRAGLLIKPFTNDRVKQAIDNAVASCVKARPRILIADDDEDVIAVLVQLLNHDKGDVTIAHDGESAVAKIREAERWGDPFAAVVLDYTMPRLTGEDVLKIIKREMPDIGVVMYTQKQLSNLITDYHNTRLVKKEEPVQQLVSVVLAVADNAIKDRVQGILVENATACAIERRKKIDALLDRHVP